ncbi:MAG TPA: prolipoprotein diacylglyceryl transferase [Chloroflexota bacterium]|nr:prolipoprotein diacylglyceryl transferase [Chloroflexota bacterium]
MFDQLQIDRIAFEIPIPLFLQERFGWGPSFPIFWYGIIIVIGIALGAWWAVRELRKRDQPPRVIDEFYNGLIIVVFSGYFFARITYVILDMMDGGQYDTLLDMVNVRAGGVNILGGFVGAAVVGWLYAKWRKLPIWHYADVAGPALLLAQAIGRWGNFINQELYGPPTTLPWGLRIEAPYRLPEYITLSADTRFHPTFLYESIALFVGFILLHFLNNRYRSVWQPGTLFGIFLVWWGGNRAWIELFRPDQTTVGNTFITYSMLMSIGLVLVGVFIALARNERLPALASGKKRPSKPKPKRS